MSEGRTSAGASRCLRRCPWITATLALWLAAPLASADPPVPARAASPAPVSAPAGTTAAPTTASPAPAAPPRKVTQADRDAARALAEQGFEKLQQRKYDAAIALFHKADELFHAPTHHVYLAQAYDKKGQLLEAADAYRKVLAETLPRDAPQPFRDAQANAARELERLLHRTPKLRVEVAGVDAAHVALEVDEHKVLPGASAFWNPGTYVVRATAEGGGTTERSVVLGDGGGEVVVTFELARPMSLGWPITALAVGVAGAGAAVATGVLSYTQARDADAACAKVIVCPPDQVKQMATAQQLRDVSIATAIAGGVALAAGLTLVLIRPTSKAVVAPPEAAESVARAVRPSPPRGLAQSPPRPRPGPTLAVRAGPSFVELVGTF